jgi:surface antigen
MTAFDAKRTLAEYTSDSGHTEPFSINNVPFLADETPVHIRTCSSAPRRNSMKLNTILVAAAAVAAISIAAASAQPYGPPQGRDQNDSYGQRDPGNYYSQTDQNGYYDRNGHYQRMRRQFDQRDGRGDRGADSGSYYQQGAYEQNCRRGNATAGTIFGAVAGGLIGGAVSHGNGGAVVGGAVVGGLIGNTVSKDIDCDDQPYAFRVYSDGLNGDIGRRSDWSHGQARGYFIPTREYRRGSADCRDFTETTYRDNRELTHTGTACRAPDGNWRFD